MVPLAAKDIAPTPDESSSLSVAVIKRGVYPTYPTAWTIVPMVFALALTTKPFEIALSVV